MNRQASFHRFALPRPKILSPDHCLLGLRASSINETEPMAPLYLKKVGSKFDP